MWQTSFKHGTISLSLVCWRVFGNSSTLSNTIPRLVLGLAWYCDATCGEIFHIRVSKIKGNENAPLQLVWMCSIDFLVWYTWMDIRKQISCFLLVRYVAFQNKKIFQKLQEGQDHPARILITHCLRVLIYFLFSSKPFLNDVIFDLSNEVHSYQWV